MFVSVIMATYNNARDIGLAVASVLLQDYEDFELVIVNDASTDATSEILKRFAAQDDRVVLLHNERNLGRARSRNRAIETARGDLLAVLDADDIAMPSRLSRQVAFMQTHPDVGMLSSWEIRIDTHNRPLDLLAGPTRDADLRRQFQWLRMPLSHTTIMFRRRAVISAGMYDPRFIRSQDSHLCRRVIQQVKAAVLPEFLGLYRFDPTERPELLRTRAKWSAYAGWDSLRQSPNVIGFLNLTRYFLLSRLPTPALNVFSGMKRLKKLPSAKQIAEVRAWIEYLNKTVHAYEGEKCQSLKE